MDRYNYTFDAMKKLTLRQMVDVLEHPRDKDGSIQVPAHSRDNPLSKEQQLHQLDVARQTFESLGKGFTNYEAEKSRIMALPEEE